MLVLIEVLQTAGIEAGRTTNDAVDIIPLFEQKLGPEANVKSCNRTFFWSIGDSQIRSILACDAYTAVNGSRGTTGDNARTYQR